MTQPHVIIAISDAWLLDSALPAVRRRGVIYAPSDAVLATQEVAIIPYKQPLSEREPATTLLPVLRLPQRQIARTTTLSRWQPEADDLPTVVIPALCSAQDDLATAMLPVPAAGTLRSATPTTHRSEPCHYCYQCGAVLPPWRESCFAHQASYGRGLPPPPTLQALPDSAVDLRPTLPLPAIIRRQRAS